MFSVNTVPYLVRCLFLRRACVQPILGLLEGGQNRGGFDGFDEGRQITLDGLKARPFGGVPLWRCM